MTDGKGATKARGAQKASSSVAKGRSGSDPREGGSSARGVALRPLTVIACAGPLVLHVARVIVDQEASTEAMITLFVVAIFGLSALVGQQWAVRFAPTVFLLSAAPLVVYAIMGIAPAYWLVLLGLALCTYELAVAGDIRENLERRVAGR